MASTFDTLEIAKRLKGAGFAEAQAEALTGVLRESRDADLSRLATNDDLTLLRSDLEILRRDLVEKLLRLRVGGVDDRNHFQQFVKRDRDGWRLDVARDHWSSPRLTQSIR